MEVSDSHPILITGVQHHDTLLDKLWGLVHSKGMVDFRVDAGGRLLWAHQVILGLFIDTKQLLAVAPQHRHGSNLDLLLKFVYLGAVSVPEDQMDALLELARQLDFSMLVDAVLSAKSAIQVAKPSTPLSTVNDATYLEPSAVNSSTDTLEVADQTPGDWAPILPKLEVDWEDFNNHLAKPQTIEPIVSVQFSQDVAESITPDVDTETKCGEQLPGCSVIIKTEVDSDSFESPCDQVEESGNSSEEDANEIIDMDGFLNTQIEINDDEMADSRQSLSEEPDEEFDFVLSKPLKVESDSDVRATDEQEDFNDSEPDKMTGADEAAVDSNELTVSLKKRNRSKLKRRNMSQTSDTITIKETENLEKEMPDGSTKEIQCSMCEKKYNCPSKFIIHFRSHTGEKPFKCRVCPRTFAAAGQLKSHSRIHSNERRFNCTQCPMSFKWQGSLDEHLRIHNNVRPHQCEVCSKTFTQISSLRTHLKIHTGERPYKCHLCERRFASNTYLKEHVRSHDEKTRYKCDVCAKTFVTTLSFVSHSRVHTGETFFECTECPMKFKWQTSLVQHMRIHRNDKPHKCEVCFKTFTQLSNLRVHVRMHTVDKLQKCPVCKMEFESSGALSEHVRTSHSDEPGYKCEVCPATFMFKRQLTEHFKTHAGQKPYKCDVCQKSYSAKRILNNHYRTHTGEMPYKCRVCDKVFSREGILRRHAEIHTGEKPYECPVCHKSFLRKSVLNRHQKIHTGLRPYQCEECPMAFIDKTDLRRHFRAHTGEKPYKCSVCEKSYFRLETLKAHCKVHDDC